MCRKKALENIQQTKTSDGLRNRQSEPDVEWEKSETSHRKVSETPKLLVWTKTPPKATGSPWELSTVSMNHGAIGIVEQTTACCREEHKQVTAAPSTWHHESGMKTDKQLGLKFFLWVINFEHWLIKSWTIYSTPINTRCVHSSCTATFSYQTRDQKSGTVVTQRFSYEGLLMLWNGFYRISGLPFAKKYDRRCSHVSAWFQSILVKTLHIGIVLHKYLLWISPSVLYWLPPPRTPVDGRQFLVCLTFSKITWKAINRFEWNFQEMFIIRREQMIKICWYPVFQKDFDHKASYNVM